MRSALPGAFLTMVFVAACEPSTADVQLGFEDLGTSDQEARVTPQQASQAKVIVDSTKGYLPYAFTEDGCYARALYMSMELAGRRIPTSAQYLHGYLQPSTDVAWGWHVAPMVEVIGTSGKQILDPALAPNGPVTLEQWIALSNPQGSYTLQWTLGSVYFTEESAKANAQSAPVIQSFAELTPFKAADISHACETMHAYLDYEGASNVATKQKLLLGRTRTLLNRLVEVGKISGYSTGGAVRCGSKNVPLCREAGAACSGNDDCCSLSCSAGVCQPRTVDTLFVDAGTPPLPPATDAGTPPPFDPGVPVLTSGIAVTGLSGATSSNKTYAIEVPAGAASLKFELKGGSGDADLYVRFGAKPTTATWDYRPYLDGSNETVNAPPKAGWWYVTVRGYSSYSGVSLKATR